MTRRKKFRPLAPHTRAPRYQLPVVEDRSGGVVQRPGGAVTAESSQVTSIELVPVDGNLLDRARTQWQFGDWDSLRQIDQDSLQHHPDRAKLALLAAAGHYHAQNNDTASQLIRKAQEWGCSKRLIAQVLISGVHNTLGRAAAVSGDMQRAIEHFNAAVDTGAPRSDRLVKQARMAMQLQQLGIQEPFGLLANGSKDPSDSTLS